MQRVKTYLSDGSVPNGRLYATDLNSIQDAAAALTDLTQHLSIADVAIGESGLLLSRFGAGQAQLAGSIRVASGVLVGTFTTTQRDAIAAGKRPPGMQVFNSTTNRIEYNAGSDATPNWQPISQASAAVSAGLLSARPSAASSSGLFFYATDQAVLYYSDGSGWTRIGAQPGDLFPTLNNAANTGRILLQGQAWPSTTGIYADLFAKIGGAYPTTLPDLRGRALVNLGTHADVNGIGLNEGLAVASRRPKHKHTVTDGGHSHSLAGNAAPGSGGTGPSVQSASFNPGAGINATQNAVTGVLIGPQTGSEPTDSEAYFVVNYEAKL